MRQYIAVEKYISRVKDSYKVTVPCPGHKNKTKQVKTLEEAREIVKIFLLERERDKEDLLYLPIQITISDRFHELYGVKRFNLPWEPRILRHGPNYDCPEWAEVD